jgi:hypothetical protein
VTNLKIPSKILIGGFNYSIETGRKINDELNWADCTARVDHSSRTIQFSSNVDQIQKDNDFIHEILHCINRIYLDKDLSEDVISLMANGFHQVFEQLDMHFVMKDESEKNEKE